MSITIIALMGPPKDGVLARVQHEESEFTAALFGNVRRARASREPVRFEMDYRRITACIELAEYDDEDSGLWQGQGDSVIIRGRVAQVIHDGDECFVDLYLRKGAEFFCFKVSDAGVSVPAMEVGIEIRVLGLEVWLSPN